MNKENNRSAAGLRRSAIAERIRLREEWSELKGTPETLPLSQNSQHARVLTKKPQVRNNVNRRPGPKSAVKRTIESANVARSIPMSSEVLVGVVALVEVGAVSRALPLRAALAALGASVVPAWSPIVTHVVWTHGGCRGTRARALALAARLVSPLWVEACAAAARRAPERAFPAAARADDLPSPRTLRQLLKKAEMENIPILDLMSDDDKDSKPPRLRMSSETEVDTSEEKTTDTSRDTTHDTSKDTTRDKTEIESRVNTAPRRAMPISISPAPPAKSRRKLFTQKEAEITKASDNESDAEARVRPVRKGPARDRRELARAERLARRLVRECVPATQPTARETRPRIVLTGMGKTERQSVLAAIRSLNGKVQRHVTWKTTHVLLGSCREDDSGNICSGNTTSPTNNPDISGVATLSRVVHRSDVAGGRTLKALLGAARGCRVLRARWAAASRAAGLWLHHHGHEVTHLRKIAQKARIERTALCRMRSDYAYDVFNGMRVRLTSQTEQKDAAIQLLKLCGAIVLEGDTAQQEDMVLGIRDGEVGSKWVFDSVAAGRMRTARRYVNNSLSGTVITQTNR